MTALSDAVSILDGLDPEHVAGCLTTSKVPDAVTDLEGFRTLMQANGLDDSLVPPKRREVDDFAFACRSVETRRGKVLKGERVSVGEVVTNAAESVYQITHEQVDAQNRVINHPKAMRVVYDKTQSPADPIRVEPMEPSHYEALKHLEDAIRARFFALRGTLPGSKVRAILRELFKQMNATRWSSANSVWFVPKEHAGTLEAIERVLKAAYPDAEFDSIPLPNTTGVRKLVEEKVGAHVGSDATKLMAEIAEKLRDGASVREDTFKRANDRAREIRSYAERMEKMLGAEVEQVAEATKLIDAQLMEMWGRVK